MPNPKGGLMEDKFSLPANSWNKIKEILRAFWTRWSRLSDEQKEKGMKLDDVAQTGGINKTLVSANNAFLKSIGIILGARTFKLTELGQKLAQAIDFDQEIDTKNAIAEIAKQSEFLMKILDAVRIRKSMSFDALRNHTALTAGVAKSDQTMQGSKAIIDFLFEGNLLETDGENLVIPGTSTKESKKEPGALVSDFFGGLRQAKPTPDLQKPEPLAALQIKLNLTARDIKENPKLLAKAIREFIEELKSPPTKEPDPEKDKA